MGYENDIMATKVCQIPQKKDPNIKKLADARAKSCICKRKRGFRVFYCFISSTLRATKRASASPLSIPFCSSARSMS